MECPGCGHPAMAVESFEAKYGGKVELDICRACHGMWVDGHESTALTVGSTLQLFKSMHEGLSHPKAPLLSSCHCPRCAGPLLPTQDRLVGGTRFSYFGCQRHGRFITFYQWLREKALLRPPSAEEIQELKARVKVVSCSNCGGPVPLDETISCSHCLAPISILSRDSIEKNLMELLEKERAQLRSQGELIVKSVQLGMQAKGQHPSVREDVVNNGILGLLYSLQRLLS